MIYNECMLYHASSVNDLKRLTSLPVFASSKRENVLVYLADPVGHYCREHGFSYEGRAAKWGTYGFDQHGILVYEEYYSGALEKEFRGVSGSIYSLSEEDFDIYPPIRDVYTSEKETQVLYEEFIPDAYEEMVQAASEGKIRIVRYEELNEHRRKQISETVRKEYEEASGHPEYRFFLKENFPEIV